MSQSDEHKKKRKHHSKEKDKKHAKVKLDKKTESEKIISSKSSAATLAAKVSVDESFTPFLATFPGISVPEDTKFQTYKSKQNYIIHGESDRLEYDGQNGPEEDLYYVAVYDPESNSLDLTKAEVVNTNRTIKAMKKKKIAEFRQATVLNRLQRTALGEAFGTKKAKKAIGDLERNKIEAEKLSSFADSIIDNIKGATENLPSQDALREQQSDDRPIPPVKEDAESVEEIYPLIGLLTKEELSAIRVGAIFRESDLAKKVAFLPCKSSDYLNTRVRRIVNEDQTLKLKLIYYASLLMGLLQNKRASNKHTLFQKLNHPPEVLVDSLIQRFTEIKVGAVGKKKESSFTITPKLEDKILCYLFVTCLKIDEYSVEIPILANELSLRPSKAQELFKSLGCKIKPCTVAQKEALGLTNAEAANYKFATLSLPFKLPEVVRRRRAGPSRR
ncbi:RNA polymerase I associated factor, A49-like protein [Lipomyces japonicus]|uniref:RNA polymerase I associated factor, A49-like protein n=1 Tax=Lipomyces japonicus TaxID=56871 RepID=UPI0034CF4064